MKKRGFTLVELLAVIGILAVILILAVPKVNDYILSSKKQTFINNALNIARQLEYDNMDYITFDKAYIKDFELDKLNKNDIDINNSLVYVENNEIYIDLVGKGSYEGFYVCHVNSGSKNVTIQNTTCGTSTDGLVYINFEVDLDGGDSSQKYNNQYVSGNYLNLIPPKKYDLTFAGWEVVSGDSVISGNRIKFGTEATTIKALWKQNSTLTVDLNGGTSTQRFKERYPGGTVIALEKPTREGYVFVGWERTSGNSIISGNTLTMGSEDTVITSKWTANTYTINYNLNGGTVGESAPTEGKYGSIVTVSKPSKTGYTFTDWTVSGTGASINDTSLTIGISNMTLTANWTINTYTITYDLDGGTNASENPTSIEYGSTVTIYNPTKEGYVFAGWEVTSGNSILSGNIFTIGSEDTTIKALWKKAQALYTESDNVLTFVLSEHEYAVGETYNSKAITNVYTGFDTEIYHLEFTGEEGTSKYIATGDAPWAGILTSIKSVIFADIITPISTTGWFTGLENCSYFDVTKLDVSQVEDMGFMFQQAGYNASTFEILGLDNWDVSNVTNMKYMFSGTGYTATTFNIGDLSNWNTSKVTDMFLMFNKTGYTAATFNIGNLGNWNTSNVTDMSAMFQCTGYTATTFNIGNLGNWDTSKVTDMSYMFGQTGYTATTFNIGNLGNWNTSNVTNMYAMFNKTGYTATTFNIGDLSNWNTSNVTNMSVMFQCTGYTATTFNIGNLGNWDTSKVTDMSYMFNKTGYTATTFNIGNLDNWNTSNVTNMRTMFQHAGYSATTFNIGNLSGWNTSKVTDMAYMFGQTGYTATTFNIGNLGNWNTSNVTNMYAMFNKTGYTATTFNIGNLGNWDTSKVTNMSYMFNQAGYTATTFNIGNLDNWNTSNVTDMSLMFQHAGYSATTFNIGNLSGWNTSKVTDMSYMFYSTGYKATTFNIGNLDNWDTSNVTNMRTMFYYVGYNATTFNIGNLSNWDTSNVTEMRSMFNCAGYTATYSLNLSSWNVNKVTSHDYFNSGVTSKVTAPKWVN